MVISPLVRNSVAANILIATSTAHILRWTDARLDNSIQMDQPMTSSSSSSSSSDDEVPMVQQNVERYCFVEPLPTKTILLQHPCRILHQNPWDKLFDCWQNRWNVTFCSSSSSSSSSKNDGWPRHPKNEEEKKSSQQEIPQTTFTDDKCETTCNQPLQEDDTLMASEDSTFRQRKLRQQDPAAVDKVVNCVDDSGIIPTNKSNSLINNQDTSTTDISSSSIDSIPIENGELDSSILGIISCHGIEPRIHDYSILVEEMSCTSMIHDLKRNEESTSNKLTVWIQNLFSGTLFQKRVQTTVVEDQHHNNDNNNNDDDDDDSTTPPRTSPCPDILLPTVSSKINQDRAHVLYPLRHCESTIIAGVYDGHGQKGELVAEYIMNAIEEKLSSRFICNSSTCSCACNTACRKQDESTTQLHSHDDLDTTGGTHSISTVEHTQTRGESIKELYTDIFREVDRDIGSQPLLRPLHNGSTACVVLLSPSKLYVANVGDSRAVVGSKNKLSPVMIMTDPSIKDENNKPESSCSTIQAIELTIDQNANDPVERQRILDCGGYVTLPRKGLENEIPARVWSDERCTQIGLGMSRSFGDFALKDVGVIVDPVITEVDLDPEHEFLILATDGVWEFIDSSEAVDIVSSCFDRGLGANEACEELINCAKDRWTIHEGQYRDDITAIILRLNSLWTEEGKINYTY